MQKLAKELGVVIPVSFFEEANNAHYNSVAVIDADGTDLGLYRKSHIPDGPGIVSSHPFPLVYPSFPPFFASNLGWEVFMALCHFCCLISPALHPISCFRL